MSQKVIKVGSSLALVIPKETAHKYNLEVGRSMELHASSDGVLTYTPTQSDFVMNTKDQKVAKIAVDFINRYRKDLEALKDK
jgi:antitoxin component of MazEF toxin-antitoxin module